MFFYEPNSWNAYAVLRYFTDMRFNHNNKVIGKKIVDFRERKKILADRHYRIRQKKSAIDNLINKLLILYFSK